MDKTVTNGNDAKRIHSSDLRDLSDTLKVKNNNKYYYLEERIEMMNEAQRSQTKQVQPKARGMHK